MQENKRYAVPLLLAILLFLCGCGGEKGKVYEAGLTQMSEAGILPETDGTERCSESSEASSKASAGYVYVCGAVKNPGVYPLYDGMRVYEAIALAGGFAEGADEEWLNQARSVSDGERLYVCTLEETSQAQGTVWEEQEEGASTGETSPGQQASDGKVNLNTATKEELMTLSGIGEAKADAILQYRREHGAFQAIEEIQNISGIKSGVYEKIKEQITV